MPLLKSTLTLTRTQPIVCSELLHTQLPAERVRLYYQNRACPMTLLKLLFSISLLLLSSDIEARYVSGIPNICLLPPPHSEGICTIETEGYYYDPATQDCVKYSIGACRLIPGQSFGSQVDCITKCVPGQRRRNPNYYMNE